MLKPRCYKKKKEEESINKISVGKKIVKQNYGSGEVEKNRYKEYVEHSKNTKVVCYRCGSQSHTAKYDRCPAKAAKCLNCGIVGHYARVCKKKQVSSKGKKFTKIACVQDSDDEEVSDGSDEDYLDRGIVHKKVVLNIYWR